MRAKLTWFLKHAVSAAALVFLACSDAGSPEAITTPSTGGSLAAGIVGISGEGASAVVGSALAESLTVRVVDQNGAGVSGMTVQFTPTGGGAVVPSTATSGANGIARSQWTLGTTVGAQSVEVRAGTAGIPTLTLNATALVAPPAQLTKVSGDQSSATTGGTIPVSVLVRDQFGNVVSAATITWQATAGGGTVTPATSRTDAGGVAQATWTLGNAGMNLVTASVTPAVVTIFTAMATAIVQPPAPVTTIEVLPNPLVLTVGSTAGIAATTRDASGNVLPDRAVSFLSSNPAVATVSNVGIVQAVSAGQTTVTATSEGKSGQSLVTVSAPVPVAPPAPSGLTATAASSSQINLSWTDNSATESAFQIESQATGAAIWIAVVVAPNSTTYQHVGLTPSTGYSYRVRACNGSVCSAYTSVATATTTAPPPIAPAAPSGLTATAVSSSQINLSWTDNSTTETGFEVESQAAASNTWVASGNVGSNATTYQQAGISPSTLLSYRVRACIGATCSAYSNVASATTAATSAAVAPPAPEGVTVTLDATGFGVVISWVHNGSGTVTSFRVTRKSSDSAIVAFTWSTPASVRTLTDAGNSVLTAHDIPYAVQACNAAGCSAAVERTITVPRLEPPTGLRVTGVAASGVALFWNVVAKASGYIVLRHAGNPDQSATVGRVEGSRTFVDTAVTPGLTYYYRVVSVVGERRSVPSEEVSAIPRDVATGVVPVVTTHLPFEVYPISAQAFTHTIPSGLVTTAWVEWGTSPTLDGAASTPPRAVGSGTIGVPIYETIGAGALIPNTTYYYRGVAQNSAGIARGAIVSFTTAPPAPPSNVQATIDVNRHSVVIAWTHDGGNAASFRAYRRDPGSTMRTAVDFLIFNNPTGAPVRTRHDSSYTVDVTHDFIYQVDACNNAGCQRSAEVSITTPLLAAPGAMTVTGTSASGISLRWTNNAFGASGVRVFRYMSGDAFLEGNLIKDLAPDATTFTDTGSASQPLRQGVVYTYYVVAYIEGHINPGFRSSLQSNRVTATLP